MYTKNFSSLPVRDDLYKDHTDISSCNIAIPVYQGNADIFLKKQKIINYRKD
jgi:hypothetical protein